MKFVFLFLGKTRERYLDAGIRDYAKRLERLVQVECVIIKESSSGKMPEDVLKKQEASLLLDKCKDASFLVALDPGGNELDSVTLAENISAWEEKGLRTIHFLIGGHYGLHQDVLQRADFILSLSRMTFTHEMTRLVLMEQLYRGCMIKAGRSYHY
ncbi:MAG: 23S rRNA (pseudouridine(1915)-N(3))-methyltransferase RlmH [Desulfobulbaceae bacterium]|nr:23S rRNA (pseudouridine(1915)-N(3))-methyltransferase RlmH [Desulfobulbaceae bacterium]